MRAQIAYSPDNLQVGPSFWNVEVAAQHPLTDALSGEIGAGYSHGNGVNGYDYGYGWVGVTGVLLRTQWDVGCVDTTGAFDSDIAGRRVVLTLSWGQHLR